MGSAVIKLGNLNALRVLAWQEPRDDPPLPKSRWSWFHNAQQSEAEVTI